MSSAVAVALNVMAYRSDTSTVQPSAVKTSTAASLAAELNEPELWCAYTINTFLDAKTRISRNENTSEQKHTYEIQP